MSAKKKLNIGLVGCGFMGRTHSNAFSKVNQFFDLEYQPVLKAVCARNAEGAKAFAGNWGFEAFETDWRELVARDDIDLVDIASPNDTHAEIAIAAAKAGKMVMCEKPLGRNAAEAEKMVAAVEAAKRPNMVWYNYRRVPAVTLAKQLVDEGRLGRIFHYRAKFLQDWTISADLPQGGTALWRLDARRRRQRRHRRPARPLHRHGDVAERADRQSHRDDRDLHQGAQPHHHRQGRAGEDRRCQRLSRALSTTARSRLSRRRATRAATRRSTRSKSTARMHRSCGTCTICIGCNISTIATRAGCAAGVRCTSPMATIPT